MTTKSPKKPTPRSQLKIALVERNYWYGQARKDTRSLSRTLKRVAEVEAVCAKLEEEIRRGGK